MSADRERATTRPEEREPETGVLGIHEPIVREHAEPRDGFEPTPPWLFFLALAIVGFGGYYLGAYSGNFDPMVYNERAISASIEERSPPPVDPMVLGRRLYNTCASCHQADGRGVAEQFPPLDRSEWVLGPPEVLARILLHGVQGEIVVLGETYNQAMPAWGNLPDRSIAAVLTYIRASWSNDAPAVDPELVARVRRETARRARPYVQAELDAVRERLAEAPAEAESTGEDGSPGAPGEGDDDGR